MRKGDQVICRRTAPAKGCWHLFDGRIGEVVVPHWMGEVGVAFEPDAPPLWFLPSELRYANHRPPPPGRHPE